MDRVCPEDGTALRHIERSGVHVDACPSCRGVWLDRGELDKIIERERSDFDDFEREIAGRRDDDDRRGGQSGGHGGGHGGGYAKPHKKKKRHSILEELLDFG